MNLLLCEGAEGSPDVRVLNKLLLGHGPEIFPMGGKYGMGIRILARRESSPMLKVAGLIDGDFPSAWELESDTPTEWKSADDKITFGWRWSRKEIENYLIDPNVVARSLGKNAPTPGEYKKTLDAAAAKVSCYQAARTALSNCRKRFRDLPSTWTRKKRPHGHVLPDDFSEAGCRSGIQGAVERHSTGQAVTVEKVTLRFDTLLPEFAVDGARRRDFLWTFSGKDILLAAEDGLKVLGFASSRSFRERLLLGIEATEQDVATWIAEWANLREAVQAF